MSINQSVTKKPIDLKIRLRIGLKHKVFDYDANQYVDLNLDGDDFEGFDYATGTRYTGEVREQSVRIFDYGEFTDFEYSLKSPN